MAEILRIAGELAAARPGALLPCPVCAAAVRAANLDHHLRRQHPGAEPGTSWAGTDWRGGRLTGEGHGLSLRRWAGLSRSAVAVPRRVVVGSLTRSRPDPAMTSYADDINVPYVTERAGTYLQIDGAEGQSIVVACRKPGPVRKVWDGWTQGPARRRRQITLADGDFVALQYLLAGRGLLRPRAI